VTSAVVGFSSELDEAAATSRVREVGRPVEVAVPAWVAATRRGGGGPDGGLGRELPRLRPAGAFLVLGARALRLAPAMTGMRT